MFAEEAMKRVAETHYADSWSSNCEYITFMATKQKNRREVQKRAAVKSLEGSHSEYYTELLISNTNGKLAFGVMKHFGFAAQISKR